MQILILALINIVILAVVLPLFYIFIISRARERLEDEAIKKVRDELSALVREFNSTAVRNLTLLEDTIAHAESVLKELKENTEKNTKHLEVNEIYNSKENKTTKPLNTFSTTKKSNNTETQKETTKGKEEVLKKQKLSYVEENRLRLLADEDLEDSVKDIYKTDTILKLHKNGFSVKDISLETGCSITEINLVVDMFSKD